jgi:hypothetical protein
LVLRIHERAMALAPVPYQMEALDCPNVVSPPSRVRT